MFKEETISKFRTIQTPFYYYEMDLLRETLSSCSKEAGRYDYFLHYALKANSNPVILSLISRSGYGADCVSGNEIRAALQNGFPPGHIMFSGVGKSDDEIRLALQQKIQSINVESRQEMEVINDLAGAIGLTADISLRIIPNVDARTHRYITTGLEENKFGILPWEFDKVLDKLKKLENLRLIGLHFHIGSQITDLDIFKSLCHRVNEINAWFISNRVFVEIINVGGGLGIDYGDPDKYRIPDFSSYFRVFKNFIELQGNQQLHFEPGRAIVGQCGSLITKVLFVKKGVNTRFAIVDAGMNDLIRPALYQSYHKIENLTSNEKPEKYDVVGPICESSDCFGKAISLPKTSRNDLLAIRSTGAYGQTMASQYNLRDLAATVYSDSE
ncbi:MAG TPA: diaminopimelate decarboxylase [Bacteroidales bacterium]|nr:diaminopimelate decarboxylase [Bacteroidales bacterium]